VNDIKQKLTDAIAAKKFDVFELVGFKLNVNNALLVGAAIGYELGLAEG
jgi:hypothetical protein